MITLSSTTDSGFWFSSSLPDVSSDFRETADQKNAFLSIEWGENEVYGEGRFSCTKSISKARMRMAVDPCLANYVSEPIHLRIAMYWLSLLKARHVPGY